MNYIRELENSWYEQPEVQVLQEFFSGFLRSTRALSHPSRCRVFVSHQRQDVHYAVRIANIATGRDFEYWLDVHDPVLSFMGTTTLPPPLKALLIASIVEMNLLNCSHVCSIQTPNTATSRWVPNEFGRAKSRYLHSMQAASWFESGSLPSTAEYLLLGRCLHSMTDVENWLESEGARLNCGQ
jgi:hypothetical protein